MNDEAREAMELAAFIEVRNEEGSDDGLGGEYEAEQGGNGVAITAHTSTLQARQNYRHSFVQGRDFGEWLDSLAGAGLNVNVIVR